MQSWALEKYFVNFWETFWAFLKFALKLFQSIVANQKKFNCWILFKASISKVLTQFQPEKALNFLNQPSFKTFSLFSTFKKTSKSTQIKTHHRNVTKLLNETLANSFLQTIWLNFRFFRSFHFTRNIKKTISLFIQFFILKMLFFLCVFFLRCCFCFSVERKRDNEKRHCIMLHPHSTRA